MSLWLYDFVSRAKWLNYRGKIMLMAFVGTHVPLLAIICYFAISKGRDLHETLVTIGIALSATLIGTGVTLFVLDQLLRPIIVTSRGLRRYRTERTLPDLPTHFTDEAGTLMADAAATLAELDGAIYALATYDRLTGLPNRSAFLDEIAARTSSGRKFAVCVFRLERYLHLAAAFDQHTADRTLIHLADSLRSSIGERGFLARVEDSTVAAILPTGDDVEQMTRSVSEAITAVTTEIAIGTARIVLDLGVGIALFPGDGHDATALLDNATAAIVAGPMPGNAPVRFFAPSAREKARERFLTEQELRSALANAEFRLHYQPVIDSNLGRVIGGEALIRWQHPTRGLIGPNSFIPVAEASGLIDPIGSWVTEEACSELKRLKLAGRDDLRIAINLSAKQFRDPALRGLVASALTRNDIAAGNLELELTETAAMEDRGRAAHLLHELREMGLSIAIDDFGTGYSSMSNLLDLPFDRLKIDRRFVSGIERGRSAHAICAAVLALAKSLGTDVLAEGVEAEAELDLLRAMGCHQFQGFYFAPAVPGDVFLSFANDLKLTAGLMGAAMPVDQPTRLSA